MVALVVAVAREDRGVCGEAVAGGGEAGEEGVAQSALLAGGGGEVEANRAGACEKGREEGARRRCRREGEATARDEGS